MNYFSILTDEITNMSVVEQEALYILFMVSGVSIIHHLSIESVKNGNSQGVCDSIQMAFTRFAILKLDDRIVGLAQMKIWDSAQVWESESKMKLHG